MSTNERIRVAKQETEKVNAIIALLEKKIDELLDEGYIIDAEIIRPLENALFKYTELKRKIRDDMVEDVLKPYAMIEDVTVDR